MTPEQAERLRDLFFEARTTTREAQRLGTAKAFAADDAAVEAFNTALKEATERLRMIADWADAMIEESNHPQYGRDVKTLIEAPLEELRQ